MLKKDECVIDFPVGRHVPSPWWVMMSLTEPPNKCESVEGRHSGGYKVLPLDKNSLSILSHPKNNPTLLVDQQASRAVERHHDPHASRATLACQWNTLEKITSTSGEMKATQDLASYTSENRWLCHSKLYYKFHFGESPKSTASLWRGGFSYSSTKAPHVL